MRNLFRNVNFWIAVIILILPIVFPEDVFRTLSLTAIYAIAALGMSLLLGYTGQISLGHAAFLGIGAYTTAILTTQYNCPVILAFIASIVMTALIALIIGKPILKTKGFFLALTTLGFGEIFFVFTSRTDPVIGGLVGIGGIPYFTIAGYEFVSYTQIYYLNWIILYGLVLYSQSLVNSRSGRALRAISTDETAASTMGIDVTNTKLKVFILSSVYAGIAGSLLATYLSMVQPYGFRVNFSIFIVLSVIVGGMGQLWGVVAATVLLTWLKDEYLNQYQEYSVLIYGIILILILIFIPQGFGLLGQTFLDRFQNIRLLPKLNKEK